VKIGVIWNFIHRKLTKNKSNIENVGSFKKEKQRYTKNHHFLFLGIKIIIYILLKFSQFSEIIHLAKHEKFLFSFC